MPGIEYLEAPSPAYQALNAERAKSLGMEGFRLLHPDELPDDKVKMGFEYDSWCVNPMVYCSFLLRRFGYLGGKVVKKQVRSPVEIFEMRELGKVDAVINASGVGFGDPDVFITRGLSSYLTHFPAGLTCTVLTSIVTNQVKRALSQIHAQQPSPGRMRMARGPSRCHATSMEVPSSEVRRNLTIGIRTRLPR